MSVYEYKVIPAPNRAVRVKGVKGTQARFANAVQVVMNEQAGEGWEYLRMDTLPCEERSGLRGRVTVYQNLLVFRRGIQSASVVELVPETVAVIAPVVAEPEADVAQEVPENLSPEADSGGQVARLGPALRRPEMAADAD